MNAWTHLLRDRERRYRLLSLLSVIFAFLLPLLGWWPMLALWLVHLACLFREASGRGMRVFYGCMLVPVSALLLWDLLIRLYLL